MQDAFDEYNEWDEYSDLEEGAEFIPEDPLDQLTKREMDLFFRVLDMVPDAKREAVMSYLMDNPRLIRAVVDNVKTKRELIKNNDVEGMRKLLEEENVVLDKIDEMSTAETEYAA